MSLTYDFDNFPRSFQEYDEEKNGLDYEDDDTDWDKTLSGRIANGDTDAMLTALSIFVTAAHYTPAMHRPDELDDTLREIAKWITEHR